MTVTQLHDPAEFAAIATPLLLRDEAENCFWLGLLSDAADLARHTMCLVRDDSNACVAIATMSPGRHMVVSRAPDAAAIALAQHLHLNAIALPGIGGVRESAQAFAGEWTRLSGAAARVHVELAVHQLTRVIPPPPAAGRMRIAQPSDVDLVARWITDFRIEIREQRLGGAREIAAARVRAGNLFLWEDGARSVAMTGVAGPTPHGIRVNLVYTLPGHRGRGYASNLVAAVSQRMLDGGRTFCFLYTDLANPTSNKIYRQIGYEPRGQSLVILFDGATGTH